MSAISEVFDTVIQTTTKIIDILKLIRDKSDVPKIKLIEMVIAQMQQFMVAKQNFIYALFANQTEIVAKFSAVHLKLDQQMTVLQTSLVKVSDDLIEADEMDLIAKYFTDYHTYDSLLSEYLHDLDSAIVTGDDAARVALRAEMKKFERTMAIMSFITKAFTEAVSIGDKLEKLPEFIGILCDLVSKNKDLILLVANTAANVVAKK